MNKYAAIFKSKGTEIIAEDLYEAKKKAIEFFKPKKKDQYLVCVQLQEKNGEKIEYAPVF